MASIYYLPTVVQYVQVGGQPRRYASLGPPFVGGVFETDASALFKTDAFALSIRPPLQWGVLGACPHNGRCGGYPQP
jgi:hypothetical protein